MANGVLRNIIRKLGRSSESVEVVPVSPSEMILRDVCTVNDQRTIVEVRVDGVRFQREGQADEFIPLTAPKQLFSNVDEEIRFQVAKKIALLVPTLAESKKKQLLEYTIKVLSTLADDQALRVRHIIAEELKDTPNAPPELIRKLAWDDHVEIACPILEFSPLLGDTELLDIISSSHIPGVTEAIARRKVVSETVSAAIVDSNNTSAIHSLIVNQGAHLSERTLSDIIDKAPNYEVWHEPLLLRPELTLKTINRIAGFVSMSLVRRLQENNAIDVAVARNVMLAVNSRLRSVQTDRERSAEVRANELYAYGLLNQDHVNDALDRNDHEFVIASMAVLSSLSRDVVKRVLNSQNAKAITALAWKAGLPMRTAIQLQVKIGRIPPASMLNAKDGVDYPLSDQTMKNYLEHFTG